MEEETEYAVWVVVLTVVREAWVNSMHSVHK